MLLPQPPEIFDVRQAMETLHNILYFLVNDSSMISPLFYLHIGGQTPASFYLAPNLAVRYGFIRLGGVPSYLIRVWPGRQGHHVVHTGLL
jgi:hypothetical protein